MGVPFPLRVAPPPSLSLALLPRIAGLGFDNSYVIVVPEAENSKFGPPRAGLLLKICRHDLGQFAGRGGVDCPV